MAIRRRGRFLKSYEEEVSLLRPSGHIRRVIHRKFKAICLVASPADDSSQDPNIFKNTFVVNITPPQTNIVANDVIVRWKLIPAGDNKNVTDEELIDARGPSNAVLTVVHFEDNRNIQRVKCRALLERTQ